MVSNGSGNGAPDVSTVEDTAHEEPYSVILYNDNTNFADFVVACLVAVFGHSISLATKVMEEAHHHGRALAAVEGKSEAVRHCRELKAKGLVATVEKAV